MQIIRLIRAIATYRRKLRKAIAVDKEITEREANGERCDYDSRIYHLTGEYQALRGEMVYYQREIMTAIRHPEGDNGKV